jgi:hypothetical protein
VPPEASTSSSLNFRRNAFLTPSFLGMRYTDDLIILDLTFIEGWSKETRLALLKDVNGGVVTMAAYRRTT